MTTALQGLIAHRLNAGCLPAAPSMHRFSKPGRARAGIKAPIAGRIGWHCRASSLGWLSSSHHAFPNVTVMVSVPALGAAMAFAVAAVTAAAAPAAAATPAANIAAPVDFAQVCWAG